MQKRERDSLEGPHEEAEIQEEEPAIERRRKCTNLGEREEQVVCHASALALAMTDEARWEAEM